MNKPREELKRFNYLTSEIEALYHKYALKQNLSDSAMNILYTIYEQGDGCNQSKIYKMAGVSRQTINSAVRKLEAEDIIYLEAGDGRNKRVCLTAKGQLIVEEKIKPLIAIEDEIYQSWTDEERQEHLRLTKKYLDDMSEKLEDLLDK